MKKVFADSVLIPSHDVDREVLKAYYDLCTSIKEKLGDEACNDFICEMNNIFRDRLKLPDKVFGLAKKTTGEVAIVTFPLKPDGRLYEGGWDESEQNFYILVDDNEGWHKSMWTVRDYIRQNKHKNIKFRVDDDIFDSKSAIPDHIMNLEVKSYVHIYRDELVLWMRTEATHKDEDCIPSFD